jgi:hypothetical protein
MLFVLIRSRVTCVFLINECVNVNTGVFLCCSCSLGAVVHVLLLMNALKGGNWLTKNPKLYTLF